MSERVRRIFSAPRPVIAMAHVPALPGSPLSDAAAGVQGAIDDVRRDLEKKTPINDPLATGAIVGLSAAHGRGHLFRAVLESFAYGVRHHLEVLAEYGVRPTRARVTNGGAASPLWKQIVADVTQVALTASATWPLPSTET